MSPPIHNIQKARVAKCFGLLLPVSLVPILLVGITAYPAARAFSLHAELEHAREDFELLEERRDSVERFGPLEQLEELEELRSDLRRLIPSRLSDIEIFSRFRLVAKTQGLELASIRVEGAVDLELVLDGESISMKEVRVVGDSTLDALLRWLDGIRSLGIPTSVASFSIARVQSTDLSFRFEAVLGVYHYSDAVSVDETESFE